MRQSPTNVQGVEDMETKDDEPENAAIMDDGEKKKEEIDGGTDVDMEDGPSRAEGVLKFEVQNFGKLKDTVYSDPTMIRNLQWKIMVMPRFSTTSAGERMKSLGIFLQCTPEGEGTSWSCQASAKITVINQKVADDSFTRKITHLFFQKENDWGYSNFLLWSEVTDPSKGYIKNDSIIVEIEVQAEAPHGVFWDSKKLTGFVGLKNQGATCYMNSLLQTLFFTNELRKAVYQMPTETDDINKSVGLALQRVFYDLQFSDDPVGTKKLTKSFGWETLDSFMQHDAQELCRVLLDNMESKMKGTIVEGTIPRLLEGVMESYVQCLHIDYRSPKKEPFYDIQLSIKGKKNVYESFKEYVTPEKLEGDNKYDAGEFGMQDAKKGVTFTKFAPVLHLHLLRFQYDPVMDSNYKINDRYEFPEKLDLSEFIENSQESEAKYTLHAVLVHSGDNHGGHYVVYINPKGDGKWFKFDDDVVSHAMKKEAIDNNFGGHDDDMSVRHCTNAYMLVYIRDSQIGQVLQEVRSEDIPDHLKKKFQEEKRFEAQRRKERSEAHLYIDVDVITSDVFYGWNGNDLFDSEKYRRSRFRVPKSEKLRDVVKRISSSLGYAPNQLRLWPFARRTNNTIRPNHIDTGNYDKKKYSSIDDVDIYTLNDQDQVMLAFLETIDPSSNQLVLPPYDNKSQVLLFFKYYNPRTGIMAYCGHLYVTLSERPRDLFPIMCERAGLPKDTKLLWFEEVKPGTIEKIQTDRKFEEAVQELMDGDIICFQAYEPDLVSYTVPTCVEYFRELSNKVDVLLCDKSIPNDPGFIVKLSLRMNYMQLASTVARHLGCNSMKIQFFKPQLYREAAGTAVKCSYEGSLRDMLSHTRNRSQKKMYYQLLSIPINVLENKFQFKVTWMNGHLKDEQELNLFVEKDGLVSHLFKEARRHVQSSTDEFRLLEIVGYKVFRIVPGDQPLDQLTPQAQRSYRLEEVNEEDLDSDSNSCLVQVAHFNKEVYNTFGTPFLIRMREDDNVGSIRKRIREKLGIPDKEFEKIRLAKVQAGKAEYFSDDDEEQAVTKHFLSPNNSTATTNRPWLGLDHINKSSKRTRYAYAEKPIKIHN